MESESFFKSLFRNLFQSLFRVIGAGIGIIVVIILFVIVFSNPSTVQKRTSLKILPNHDWEQKPFSVETPSLLAIKINGVIGLDGMQKDSIGAQLIESINGDLKPGQIKGIFLELNTPGGVAEDADAIYQMLKDYKARFKVPIFAYIEGMCASGGVYVACAADKIFASDDSIIGSVGVIMPTCFNFSNLLKTWEIESKTLTAGKDKDMLNPFRPWKPDEDQNLQNTVNFVYDRFTTIVSQNRPLLTRQVLEQQGAKIFPAPEALAIGFIDGQISSRDQALLAFSSHIGIQDNYQLVELEVNSLFSELFGSANTLAKGKVHHYLRLSGDLHPDLEGKPLCLFKP